MFKWEFRKNSKYPIQLLIWSTAREIEKIIISVVLNFNGGLIYTPLMFIGEFLSGLIIYSYQLKYLKYKKAERKRFFSIVLIEGKKEMITLDHKIIIYLLIFFAASFDFIQFILSIYMSRFMFISGSLCSRLSGILLISAALYYIYVLKFNILRHQIFSLIVIGACLVIVIITEFIFQEITIFLPYGHFFLALVIIVLTHFFNSLLDLIEKYLFEFNFFNPFKTLMFEGLFGFLLSCIYCIFNNPFEEIILYQKEQTTNIFIIFCILLILYTFLSGAKNAFRIVTTHIYSPMTTTLMEYFCNPLYMIYDFISDADFITGGKRNPAYFILNLILGLVISIFSCVYNEFLILFCCNFEYYTYSQIAERASSVDKELVYVHHNDHNDDDEDEE